MSLIDWTRRAAALTFSSAVLTLAACGGGGTGEGKPTGASQAAAPPPAVAETSFVPALVTAKAAPDTADLSAFAKPRQPGLPAANSLKFSLAALPAEARTRVTEAPGLMGVPRQIGYGRNVPAAAKIGTFSPALQWADRGGVKVATVQLVSEGALGLRAGVLVERLPNDAVLRFFAPGDTVEHAFSGAHVNETIARNAAAGDTSAAGRTFWSPSIDGALMVMEVQLNVGADAGQLAISVPLLSHLVFSRSQIEAIQTRGIGTAQSCNIDATCSPASLAQQNAVAYMQFTGSGGGTGICTGTLMADAGGTQTPYFLSANHCISTQTAASSLQTVWFARSSSCNSNVQSSASVGRTGGAVLLYASAATDTAFFRLSDSAPAGATFAGWAAAAPAIGTAVSAIHHPDGDLLKLASGAVRSYANCTAGAGSTFSCSPAAPLAGSYLDVNLTSGATEPGSSGSAIFGSINGSGPLVLGQLYGGTSSCSNPAGNNIYGRFDVAYNVALKSWLGGGTTPTPVPTPTPGATPQTGWWWNAGEGGRGFGIELRGSTIFLAGFMYEADGRDAWYAASMTRTASGSYSGELRSYSGGNDRVTNAAARLSTGSTLTGNVELSFQSATAGNLRVVSAGVTKDIGLVRFPVNGSAFTPSNATFESGWYWNPAESGHGYFIEAQGNSVFAGVYTYYNSGVSGWYTMQGSLSSPGVAGGNTSWFIKGQTLLGSYVAPEGPFTPYTFTFSATSATTGVMRYTATATNPAGSTVNLQRFVF